MPTNNLIIGGGMEMVKVLVIVDMLNDFMDPMGALFCGDEARQIIPVIKGKLKEYVSNGQAVIYICDSHAADDREFTRFPSHAVKGTWGAEIIPELKMPEAGSQAYYITKQRYSAFYNTGLDDLLQQICREQGGSLADLEVEVTGNCTNICVLYTVEELCNRDIKTVVLKNAVASFDRHAHQQALEQMEKVLGAELR